MSLDFRNKNLWTCTSFNYGINFRSVDYQSMLKEISTEQKFDVTYVEVGENQEEFENYQEILFNNISSIFERRCPVWLCTNSSVVVDPDPEGEKKTQEIAIFDQKNI